MLPASFELVGFVYGWALLFGGLLIQLEKRNVLKNSGKNLQRLLGQGWFGRSRGRYSA